MEISFNGSCTNNGVFLLEQRLGKVISLEILTVSPNQVDSKTVSNDGPKLEPEEMGREPNRLGAGCRPIKTRVTIPNQLTLAGER